MPSHCFRKSDLIANNAIMHLCSNHKQHAQTRMMAFHSSTHMRLAFMEHNQCWEDMTHNKYNSRKWLYQIKKIEQKCWLHGVKENLYFHHFRFLNVSNLTFFTRKIKYQIQLPHCLHNGEDIMRISILFEHLQKCFHCLSVQQNSQAI